MGKWLKILLAVAVPGAGGVAAALLGVFGGSGEGLVEAGKDLGLAWMLKSAIQDLIGGSALAFARFQVVAGFALAAGLVVLHFWRGDSKAGKFRAAWWLWCGVGGIAALLVVSGIVDGVISRIERANRRAEHVAASLPLEEPQRKALKRQVRKSLLEQPCRLWDGEGARCLDGEGR
jgi:hypothetical protein